MSWWSALGSIGGALVGGLFGKSENDSNNEAIAAENEKNRQFSHDEAILAHNRQLEIMDKQNAWNSYSNQRKLLQSAGYNPNALFNSASTLSASSGASGGAQASSPSVGFPSAYRIDPGVLSDAALKFAQAENVKANTVKTNSETRGQTLMNDYQEICNSIYRDFGRLQAEYNLNKTDADRALSDAHRLLVGTQSSLNYDELYNMRPKEAANFVSDTLMKDSQSLLNKIAAAKTDTERELLTKQYILATRVAESSIALNYANATQARANANYMQTQADLWTPDFHVNSPKGIMFRKSFNDYKNSRVDYQMNRLEYRYRSSVFNDLYDSWKESTRTALESIGAYNERVEKYMNNFESNAFGGMLMQGFSLGTISNNYRNPGPPASVNSILSF